MSYTPYHIERFSKTGSGVVQCDECGLDFVIYPDWNQKCPRCEDMRTTSIRIKRIQDEGDAWQAAETARITRGRENDNALVWIIVLFWVLVALLFILAITLIG